MKIHDIKKRERDSCADRKTERADDQTWRQHKSWPTFIAGLIRVEYRTFIGGLIRVGYRQNIYYRQMERLNHNFDLFYAKSTQRACLS